MTVGNEEGDGIPRNCVIKTLCAKDQVCKSIGVTCSTYRWFTKDKEENTRKWPKKGPQRAKNQNFEKQKIAFFSHVPRSIVPKNYVPRSKTVTCSLRTDKHTNTQTDTRMDTEYPIRALAFQSFCLWYERSNKMALLESYLVKNRPLRKTTGYYSNQITDTMVATFFRK